MKRQLTCLVGLLALGTVATANATVFYIDDFTVVRDGEVFFNDSFSDGAPPPSTPWTWPSGLPAEYGTIGTPGPEVGGKLALDTAAGLAKNSEVTGGSLLVQRSRLITNTSDDPSRGLRQDNQIQVFATYDLIAPELTQERYGIRLTDFKTDYDYNDNVDLSVQRTSTGEIRVAFREANYDLGVMDVLDQVILSEDDFIDYDQITLYLYSDAESTEVHAGFSLLGSGGSTPFTFFSSAGTIFDGETWTRAGFIATQTVKEIPVPASLSLILLGLVGLGFKRH